MSTKKAVAEGKAVILPNGKSKRVRLADLNPSLGLPSVAGPCLIVERAEQNVRSPSTRDTLERKVEKGQELSNPEARMLYDTLVERGPGGLIKKMVLTGHAQYRMDLRGISVPELRVGFQAFQKNLNDWKSQNSPEYRRIAQAVASGGVVEYLFKKFNLFVAFVMSAKGTVRVVTVYRKGEPDPKAPGTCVVPHIHKHGGYRAPIDEWTTQTYRKDHNPTPDNQEKQQVLPAPNGGKTKDLGPQTFNGPGESGSGPGGRSVHKDMARTQGKPGGDHPNPPARTSPVRRPDVTGDASDDMGSDWDEVASNWFDRLTSDHDASMRGKPYPGSNRQKGQRGTAKRYYKLRYKRKRAEYKLRANKWYQRNKNNPRYKKDQDRRERTPERFERRPAGGVQRNKDRAKEYRRTQKKANFGPPVFHLPTMQWGVFGGVHEAGAEPLVTLQMPDGALALTVSELFDQIETGEEASNEILAALDLFFEFEESGMDDMEDTVEEMQRLAFNFKLNYRPQKRQVRQKGKKKWQAKMRARKNRAKSKMRSRKRYKRLKRLPAFKKQQKIRRKHPERFKRRMAEVLTAPEIAFVIGDRMDLGYVRSVSPMTGLVTFYRAAERSGGQLWDTLESLPNEDFMASVAFLSEHDEEAMFKLLDVELGLEAWTGGMSEDGLAGSAKLMGVDCTSTAFLSLCEKLTGKSQIPDMDPAEVALVDSVIIHHLVYDDDAMDAGEFPDRDLAEDPDPADPYLIDPTDDDWVHGKVYLPSEYLSAKVVEQAVAKQAEMLYEKRPPKMDPDTVYDRAQSRVDRKEQDDNKKPLVKHIPPKVYDNPGSAKVIPWNTPDNWMNNKGASRVAARIHEIVGRCGPDLMGRSKGLKAQLRRVDKKNAMWLFDVPGSKSAYRVRLKAVRKGNATSVGELDVKVSCSCPFWQWQGPEHHAKTSDYLYGSPRGTASRPTTKDPSGTNGACKHVLAVFNHITSNRWSVPILGKTAAARYLLDTLCLDDAPSVQARAIAARYLELKGGQ